MNRVRIAKSPKLLVGEIRLPASKSISNRVLILRALSGQDFPVHNLSIAQDTLVMNQVLSETEKELYLNIGNAGTAMRFLTAYFACRPGVDVVLTGDERMLERPIDPLVEALRRLGADIVYREKEGYPPLHITGVRLRGGRVKLDASESSQFATALMLIAPTLEKGLTLELMEEIASESYLAMTLHILSEFGITYVKENNTITVSAKPLLPQSYSVESDWSSAGYWYGLASLFPGSRLVLPYLRERSCQGDSIVAGLMQKYFNVSTEYGASAVSIASRHGFEIPAELNLNMLSNPDLIPTIVTLCCLHKIPFRIGGTSTLKLKESDRGQALKAQLAKLNCSLIVDEDSIRCDTFGSFPDENTVLETYDDHRLAMCWAMVAARHPNIWIENPDCVAKSYPDFWTDIESAGLKLESSD